LKKNKKIIKNVFIIWLVCTFTFTSFVTISSAKDPIYNAKVNIRLQWSDEAFEEPIVPRDEIVTLNISVILEIKTGESFGAGLLEGYTGEQAIIDLSIVDNPSWCYAALKYDLIVTNILELAEAKTQVFLNINENAPAYAQGYITINVKVGGLGLIKGDNQTFTLNFKPAFFPLIKTEFPDINSQEIDPNTNAVFPIKVENAGNAKTKVFFEVENVPQGWSASIKDSIILGETSDTSDIVYLTVIPSTNLGYHYEETIINVKITPAFVEDIEQVGTPIYGYFIIRNRGFSSGGLEFYLPIAIILFIIIVIFIRTFRKKYKKEKLD
jgi:hypothetical protein